MKAESECGVGRKAEPLQKPEKFLQRLRRQESASFGNQNLMVSAYEGPRRRCNSGAFLGRHSTVTSSGVSGCLNQYRQTLDPYRDCPERRGVGWTGGGVGAVSIGSFELSRWRGGRGGLWDFNASVLIAGGLKQPTETKKDMMLFLKTALES